MKQCPRCSRNLADFVEVCPYCAAPLAAGRSPADAPAGPRENSGKALASLICGVVFFLWPLSAVAAVILGHVALGEIKRSRERLAGRGLAIGGLVAGYIGISMIPILIIAAIAIPNVLRARMAANEASAAGTLRTYNLALATYANQCPLVGYPPSLASLGPRPSGADTCAQADLVEPRLGQQMPVKRGYRFYYTPESQDAAGRILRYGLAADPVAPGTTGVRHFFTDESGVIRFRIEGGADAHSQPLP